MSIKSVVNLLSTFAEHSQINVSFCQDFCYYTRRKKAGHLKIETKIANILRE